MSTPSHIIPVDVSVVLTLSSLAEARCYEPGMWIRLTRRPRRWYVRLWRWATRYDRRHPAEGPYRVVWVKGNQIAVCPAAPRKR